MLTPTSLAFLQAARLLLNLEDAVGIAGGRPVSRAKKLFME